MPSWLSPPHKLKLKKLSRGPSEALHGLPPSLGDGDVDPLMHLPKKREDGRVDVAAVTNINKLQFAKMSKLSW